MSYGWIECVGHADRACYDLDQHSKRTNTSMVAALRLPEPIVVDKVIAEPNKKLLGPRFKTDQKIVMAALEALDGEDLMKFQHDITTNGMALLEGKYEITSDLVTFKSEKRTVAEYKYTPSVIEPSYGIGRILYAVLEHAFSQRDGDEQRCVMAFRPCVAPIKVGIFRLLNNAAFDPYVNKIKDELQALNITTRVDSSAGSVGRRYARADELGIPFGVTVDFQTLMDETVTVRDRDSMSQVRVSIARLVDLLKSLVSEKVDWDSVMRRFMVVNTGGSAGDEEDAGDMSSTISNATTSNLAPTVVQYSTRGSFSRPNPLLK